ncbi:hypothetical protein P3S67_016750 [Capsicum chacoense]
MDFRILKLSLIAPSRSLIFKTQKSSAHSWIMQYQILSCAGAWRSKVRRKSEEEWRAVLSPEQFRILRQKGTEGIQGAGRYNKFFGVGTYLCAGCATPLYRSTTKFNSPCGWPSFYEGLPGAINRNDPDGIKDGDNLCTCGGHLGNVF